MNYVVGGTLATLIGTNLLSHVISGTLDILYSGVSYISFGIETHNKIEKVLRDITEMDIAMKLELVQKITGLLPQNEINKIIENGLVDIIIKIKSIIEWINIEISRHNRKWFSRYRSIDFTDKINELEHLVKILDGRIIILLTAKNISE